jgi:hypothetical protein
VFPVLHIDASKNQWTGPNNLNAKFGFICWADTWPDSRPQWLDAPELAATAVIACPPLKKQQTARAIAQISGVDFATAEALLDQATGALRG